MLDIGWSEMAVIALLALVIIGPKDLPRVMRTMGKWAHKARSISREFQSGLDEMVREADLEDAKKAMQADAQRQPAAHHRPGCHRPDRIDRSPSSEDQQKVTQRGSIKARSR